MKADRWHRVKELLNEALDREPGQRTAFLNEHCAGDADLRHEVDSLIASYDEAEDDFMEEPSVSSASPRADTNPGKCIGPYCVVEEIGRGGMGTVYRAYHCDDAAKTPVAIKIVKRGMDHEFILRRFRNERSILAALDHPNIAKLLDGGATVDGLPYFVMEYVNGGRNIIEYCDEKRLDPAARLRLMMPVCSAVQAAHDRRVVHRDIKPGNILINSDGQAKLLDFGIAKILDPELSTHTIDSTATILRLMTPEYASPEQVRGDEITAASDVYSIGVLLYELMTGHRPYRIRSRSPHEIAQVICNQLPQRPSTMIGRTELVTRDGSALTLTPDLVGKARGTRPTELRKSLCGGLDNIILKAIRKEPERRYSSAGDVQSDILRYLKGTPVHAKPDTISFRFSKAIRRHRTALSAAAIALFLTASVMAIWNDFVAPRLRGPAATQGTKLLTSFPGDETQPDFSPGGARVAFVWEGENGNNSDIYIKAVRGVGLERITTDLAEDLSPTWSPDGKLIAWLRVKAAETAIYTSRAEPGETHRMIASLHPNRIEAVGRHLDWAPDGNTLAAADKTVDEEPFRIVSVDVKTGQKTQLTSPPAGSVGDSNPSFSPDGRNLAYIRGISSGVNDVFIRPLGGGSERRLTTDKRYVIGITWSADGNYILYSSNRTGNHSLWRVPAIGGDPEAISGAGENVSDPVMSSDGSLLAYSHFYLDTNIWSLDTVTAARRKRIASTQYDSSPHYSADGSKIVFRSSRSGTNEIWITDANASGEVQVTHMGNTLSGSPKISPDGTTIAFDSRPDGQPDIFTIASDGTGLKRITSEESEDVVPNWSRDGKWIYFASNRSGTWQVWKVPSTGGTPTQLTQRGGFAAKESVDGKWVYYARGRSVPGLWRIRSDGSSEAPVLEGLKPGFWAYWAVTRQGIYFADQEKPKGVYALYFLADGFREPQRVGFFDKPLIPGDQGLTASPDGRTLLYTQVDQSGSDILMIETPKPR